LVPHALALLRTPHLTVTFISPIRTPLLLSVSLFVYSNHVDFLTRHAPKE